MAVSPMTAFLFRVVILVILAVFSQVGVLTGGPNNLLCNSDVPDVIDDSVSQAECVLTLSMAVCPGQSMSRRYR